MFPISRRVLTKKVQHMFWIYVRNNFIVTKSSHFKRFEPDTRFAFVPITFDNCSRVQEFRDESRISEYRHKLSREEIGCFAERDGTMVGSIWATINNSREPAVVRSYMRLMPNEALIHDIVTGERFRGMGVGPFMAGKMASLLLSESSVSRIIVDVNVRNSASLRMMDKAGFQMKEQVVYVSALGNLLFQKTLRQYA